VVLLELESELGKDVAIEEMVVDIAESIVVDVAESVVVSISMSIVASLNLFHLCLVMDVNMLFDQLALCTWQGVASQIDKRMIWGSVLEKK